MIIIRALLMALLVLEPGPNITPDPDIANPSITLDGQLTRPASSNPAPSDKSSNAGSPSKPSVKVEYRWRSACAVSNVSGDSVSCAAARVCPDPGQEQWILWGRPEGGVWSILATQCHAGTPPVPTGPTAPRPQVTPGMVLREVRRMGLPSVQIQVQPARATLVNFDTIFYATRPTFDRSITLIGYDVDIAATAVTYTWKTGDGGSMRTDGPGGPFPSKEIVHRYSKAHVTVRPSVDVTYRVRFRIDGGGWQTIGQPLTAAGPATALDIKEAAPVLTS